MPSEGGRRHLPFNKTRQEQRRKRCRRWGGTSAGARDGGPAIPAAELNSETAGGLTIQARVLLLGGGRVDLVEPPAGVCRLAPFAAGVNALPVVGIPELEALRHADLHAGLRLRGANADRRRNQKHGQENSGELRESHISPFRQPISSSIVLVDGE